MNSLKDQSQQRSDEQQRLLPQLAYSVAEAARVTGLGKTTLYGLIGEGKLPSRKIGRRRLIAAADLNALVTEGAPV